MRKEYESFPENYIEGKEVVVGDTVFVRHSWNALNGALKKLGSTQIFHNRMSGTEGDFYGKIIEIKEKLFKIELLEFVDFNLSETYQGYCRHEEKLLQGTIFNIPKIKCLQWGKGSKDNWACCHWFK
jgi:hypothetical protein